VARPDGQNVVEDHPRCITKFVMDGDPIDKSAGAHQ
jgi:hypothetical protein